MNKSKPKTPQSELMQQKLAAQNFIHGSNIKRRNGAEFRADMRYDGAGNNTSAQSADQAIIQRTNRKKNIGPSVMVARAGDDSALTRKLNGAGKAMTALNGVHRTASAKSSIDNRRSMDRFVDGNRRRQLALDGISIAADYGLRKRWDEAEKAEKAGTRDSATIEFEEDENQYSTINSPFWRET